MFLQKIIQELKRIENIKSTIHRLSELEKFEKSFSEKFFIVKIALSV